MTAEIEKAVKYLSKTDPILSTIIKKHSKCNLRQRRNYFHHLFSAIVGQQLSVIAAKSILNKVYSNWEKLPTPKQILDTDPQTLRSFGLSNAKVKYVKDLAAKIISKELKLEGISNKSDSEVIEELTKVKGIGEWSAHMFLIFTLARLNVLPHGDLGIKRAIAQNYGLETYPTEDEVKVLAEEKKWAPYNSVAAWYLWKSLEG